MRSLGLAALAMVLAVSVGSSDDKLNNHKSGDIVVAGRKEYRMLSEYSNPEIEATFRSFDSDKGLITVRVRYEHADKDTQDEYKRAEDAYKAALHPLEDRYKSIEQERRSAAGIRNERDRAQRMGDINRRMADFHRDFNQEKEKLQAAQKKAKMEVDYIDYELRVENNAPIRKMWLPKQFDDKGKVKEYTKEEKTKFKGDDAKLPGYTAKLDDFDVKTPVKLKLQPPATLPPDTTEPTNSTTSAATTTPDPAVPAPKKNKHEVKIEDRPLVKMVTALSDPNAPPPPAKKK